MRHVGNGLGLSKWCKMSFIFLSLSAQIKLTSSQREHLVALKKAPNFTTQQCSSLSRQKSSTKLALLNNGGPTPHPADSGYAASLRAWLTRKRAGMQTSLARTAAAAYANRWAATF